MCDNKILNVNVEGNVMIRKYIIKLMKQDKDFVILVRYMQFNKHNELPYYIIGTNLKDL
jgi:hypothetical protein